MCVGVIVWFGWGDVVSLCRLRHYSFVRVEFGGWELMTVWNNGLVSPGFCSGTSLNLRIYRTCHSRHLNNLKRVKKNQLDAQLILSIFRQTLHVSDVSRPIIRRYNRMYTTIGTYYSF